MTSAHTPLVSVVTPAYNEEAHIRQCIESVLAQTYTHWDYTIVNNRSTDRTLDIAQEYAAKDHRIRIHTNETFAPVIANYNNAFRQISPESKYCKVVSADDWIYPECLEKMVRLAEEHPTAAIIGAHQIVGERLYPSGLPFPITIVSGREACRQYLFGDNIPFGAPTSLLFRADIVRSRHQFYNGPHLHADSEACLEVMQHHDFGFVHQVLAVNRVRENSLTSHTIANGIGFVEKLKMVVTFGPRYLNEHELQDCIRQKLSLYYYYLGSQICKRRGKEFWANHRRRLGALGYSLNMARVLLYAIFFAIGSADQAARTAVKGVRRPAQGV